MILEERDLAIAPSAARLYLAVFADALGQQKELGSTGLDFGEDDLQAGAERMLRNARRVWYLRRRAEKYFQKPLPETGMDGLPEQEREDILKAREPLILRQVGFSDCFTIAVQLPFLAPDEPATMFRTAHMVWRVLQGMCGMMLASLGNGLPVRAGLDIDLACPMYEQEVYGPALLKAYHLESKVAQYPRGVIGANLAAYIIALQNIPGDHHLMRRAREIARDLAQFVVPDPNDGLPTLHLFNPFVVRGMPGITTAVFDWLRAEKAKFDSGNDDESKKLAERYARLLNYCEYATSDQPRQWPRPTGG